MKTQLAEYYRHRVDLVLTSEMLGTKFAQGPLKLKAWFRDVISIHDWDVRVWIGYRPYFAFVASGFNQQYKNQNRPKLQLWPGQGGIRIPTVADGVLEYGPENEGKHKTKSKLLGEFPFTDVLVGLFQPYVDRIDVYDITTAAAPLHNHNNTNTNNGNMDFTEYIFCELLVGAEEACHAQRALLQTASDEATITAILHKNPAKSFDADRLATAAVDRGLITVTTATTSRGLQRGWVGQQIRTYMTDTHHNHPNTTTDWPPLVCPDPNNNELDRLYNVSLAHEQSLFPARDPHWQVPAQFDQLLHTKKLCDQDLDQIFDNVKFRTFLRALQQS